MRPTAVVTGASSGLGESFARKLAGRGYDLILIARGEERLRRIAAELPVHAEVVVADLGTETGVASVESAIRGCERLELLVNNAGFGTLKRFWDADIEGQKLMHQVHVMAAMRLTHAALTVMVPRKCGAVINVSSVAGFTQSEGNVSYCATKAWMTSFSEGLNAELRGIDSPVKVQALCPGYTITGFHEAMGVERGAIPRSWWMDADYVVNCSLRGLDRGQPVVIPGWRYRMVVALMRHLPGWMIRAGRPGGKDRV